MANPQVKVNVEEIMSEIRQEILREQASHVDVEQIMREIREQVSREQHEPVPAFHEIPSASSIPIENVLPEMDAAQKIQIIPSDGGIIQQMANEARYVKVHSYVPYYREMGTGAKALAKRVVRKINKPIMFALSEQQNELNLHLANGVDAARILADYHQTQLNHAENALNMLQNRLNQQIKELQKSQNEISVHGAVIAQNQKKIAAQEAAVSQKMNQMLMKTQHQQDEFSSALEKRLKALEERLENVIDCQRQNMKEQKEELEIYRQHMTEYGKSLNEYQRRLDAHDQDITAHGDELAAHREQLTAQAERLEKSVERLGNHDLDIIRHTDQLEACQEILSQEKDSIIHLEQSAADHQNRLTALDKAVDDISMSVSRVIRYYMSSDASVAPVRQDDGLEEDSSSEQLLPQEENNYAALDYFKFQNDFRGTQSQIMDRQKIYLPYFKNKTGKVMDLGCGRGEFLRLMKEENIPAFGVDTYPEYEVTGKLYDIDIRTGDGIAMLEQTTEKLGGIFCAQVIEHLGFRMVEKLCRLAYEKLEKGAYLVLETPNPMCLSTMTNAFYLDPTHDKPVHPLLMEYLLKSMGYSEVQLIWPDHSLEQLPQIESSAIDNLNEVNRAIERVSNLLYGSQDYAVIARK